jgi:hypothetical protein
LAAHAAQANNADRLFVGGDLRQPVHWLHLFSPTLHTGFSILLLGYLVLLAGNIFKNV